jgi:hypothetical protein
MSHLSLEGMRAIRHEVAWCSAEYEGVADGFALLCHEHLAAQQLESGAGLVWAKIKPLRAAGDEAHRSVEEAVRGSAIEPAAVASGDQHVSFRRRLHCNDSPRRPRT